MSTLTACRSCGSEQLFPFLDLGVTPLANSLLQEPGDVEGEPRFPLEVVLCRQCSLVQLTETVPPEVMFSNYAYFSSFSDTMLKHAREHALSLKQKRRLGPESLVVEIASNDGYLLRNFVQEGVPVLGIEPAANVAATAVAAGVRTRVAFFGEALAEELVNEGLAADVILANNVMAHIPQINGVVAGIARLLKPNGVFVMETPYIKDLLDRSEFDTIYHEHFFYYSLTALQELMQRHGLEVIDVEHLAIHGGSLRVTVARGGEQPVSCVVKHLLEEEAGWGVKTTQPYVALAKRVENLKQSLLAILRDLRAAGKRVAAYGAAAKGSTLLNACGIHGDLLCYVVDRSPHKQGRWMPGVALPIFPPSRLLEDRPDYLLLLAWNFAGEIMEQQQAYRDAGGRFLLPVPEPRVV